MARRRFNQKFAWVAAGVVAAGGLGVGAYYTYGRVKDPDKFIAAGDTFFARGDYYQAIGCYNIAEQVRPKDPKIHLKLATAYYAWKDDEQEAHIESAVNEWTRAEELQPDLKPAWQGLLEANMLWAVSAAQQLKSGRMPDEVQFLLVKRFGVAREAANQLHKLDPTDAKARSAIPILTINLRLLNLSIPPADSKSGETVTPLTDAQQVDQAVTDLTGVLREHPEDTDLPYWIAQAKIDQAIRLSNQIGSNLTNGVGAAGADGADARPANGASGGPVGGSAGGPAGAPNDPMGEVRALFGEAAIVFDDPISRQPNNAELYYKKYDVLTTLLRVDSSPDAVPTYVRAQREALEKAQSVIKPTEPNYTSYRVAWADYLARTDPARAETVYKDLIDHPAPTGPLPPGSPAGGTDVQKLRNDILVRAQYARMLERDSTRRSYALEQLKPIPTIVPQDVPAPQQPELAYRLALVRLLRTQLLTDLLELTANPTEQVRLTNEATAEMEAAASNPSLKDEYEVLKARGRLQLVAGKYRDAIVTLSLASERLAGSRHAVDYQLLSWQATAYARGGQTGEAIKLLEQAVQTPAGANNRQPHTMLAQLYLDEQEYDKGRQQVAWLTERYPDDVFVVQLQLQALGPNADPAAVAPLYAKLPEQTGSDLGQKLSWAQRTKNRPEVVRLLGVIYARNPHDPTVAMRLAQWLMIDGKTPEADKVLGGFAAANPDQADSIDVARDELHGVAPDLILGKAEKAIAKIPDPMTRAMALFRLRQSRGNLDGQVAALEQARAIQPDNAEVLNNLFLSYLNQRAFDKARAMLPVLADHDADNAHGNMFRFRLAMAEGDKEQALNLGRQLTHDFPQFAASWEFLGEAQQASGQLDAARQQFRTALDHQANNPQAMQRLVDCSIRLGQLDDARKYLADARKRFPDDPNYKDQQVRVEIAYGDPESVFPIVDATVRDHPDVAQAYERAVQTYGAARGGACDAGARPGRFAGRAGAQSRHRARCAHQQQPGQGHRQRHPRRR